MRNFFKFYMLAIVGLLSAVNLWAQSSGYGNLRGVVKDGSGNILPGASVLIGGSTRGTSTDINGAYLLQGIPAGSRQIVVSYLGYENVTTTINIESGKTRIYDVVMKNLAQSIEQVTVTAIIDGQQRALNQQKMADNQMQVLSADQIGLFPDLNVADALKRVSGITSDGEKISLRGTPNNFTNINMNGEQMIGTSEGGYRAPSLQFIPSDVLATMEVQKTLLPSNDGDAIGGVINLRSSEARSLDPRVNVDLGPGYNFLRSKMMYNGKIGYEQRFHPTDKNPYGVFGISAKYSYYNSWSGYDRLDANAWKEVDLMTGGPQGETSEKAYMPSDFRYRYVETNSIRQGGSLVLDWAPSINTKFVLMGSFNSYDNKSDRNRNRVRFRGDYWDLSGWTASDFSSVYDPELIPEQFGDHAIGTDRISEMVQYTDVREKTTNFNVNLSGETVLDNWKLDAAVSYSKSKTSYESMAYTFSTPDFRANNKDIAGTGSPAMILPKKTIVGYIPDVTSPYLAMNYLVAPNNGYEGRGMKDAQNFSLTLVETWNHVTEGSNLTARANAALSHQIGGNASTFSFGVKFKMMHNNGYVPAHGADAFAYSFAKGEYGDAALSLTNFLRTSLLSNDYLDGHMQYTYAVDRDKIRAFRDRNYDGKLSHNAYSSNESVDAYYFDARENVYAAYLMEKVQFGKLMVLGGARIEGNRVKYEANTIFSYDGDVDLETNPSGQKPENLLPDSDGPVYSAYTKTLNRKTIKYLKVLPNLQFKYDLNSSTVFRLAYTTGYARPNAADLVPKINKNIDAGVITMGNPDLKPSYSHNLDVLGEYYFKNVGVLSGGFFYKNISKFQYLSQQALPSDNPYAYQDSPFTLMRMQMNGESASVYGVEITLNSPLSFLPGFLKNLVFTGNYTFVHSEATVERMGETSSEQTVIDRLRLPGQANHTANLALAYSCKRFTIQASYNYIGEYIMSLGANRNMDIWNSGRWQLDLNGSINIYKGLSFYVEAQNVLNDKLFQYMGDKTCVYELRYTGATARCGFTYKF